MALFGSQLIDQIIALLAAHHRSLSLPLGAAEVDVTDFAEAPIRRDLALLIAVANGEHMRSAALVAEAERALAGLMALLRSNALGAPTTLPDDFWRSDLGIVASRVRWWVSGEDLITISNAAALAFGANTQANRMRIARAIESGLLEWVPDPSVANPQQNRRVLRPQVERLRDLRALPE
ncbi:hypothetical protein F8S13_01120 [Chloroflexia bacterium SDU3-3]|nr:hypothetical protein F8S13_01120 [Chloroflexia bacterium SDU3-3]